MDVRTIITAIAGIRVAIGSALFIAPRTAATPWVGESAASGGGQMALRGLGARDVALGMGALMTRDDPGANRAWIEAGVAADLADATAAALAAKDRPASAVGLTIGVATTAVGLGLWLRNELNKAAD